MTAHAQVLIVGAGLSGLTCAHALRQSGLDVQILEASGQPGGAIRSEPRDGFLLELGPQSFNATAPVLNLCRELHIEQELIEAPRTAPRFLLINGKLQPVPLRPPAFFTSSLFSLKTKFSLLRDVFGRSTPPDSDESVAAFTRRKLTPELLDKLVGPFISGIYAGDPEKLSLRAAFPQLHEAERTAGSLVRGMMRAAKSKPGPKQRPTLQSFKNGTQTLINALAANLGPALRCGVEVTSIQQVHQNSAASAQTKKQFQVTAQSSGGTETILADNLILATPTYVAAKLLSSELASLHKEILDQIEYAPIAVAALGYRKLDIAHPLNGFGFLIPRSENIRTLGSVWNSSLFPDRAPKDSVLLTNFIGGATDPQATQLSKEEIVSLVHHELSPILGISGQPTFSHVQIYPRALPQYNLGHSARIAALERQSSTPPNLRLVGNYLHGPAVGACIEQALAVANEMRTQVLPGGST